MATAYELGWSTVTNGDLILLAEKEGYELLITTDTNLRYQQNLQELAIAILVLTTKSWPRIRQVTDRIQAAIATIAGGWATWNYWFPETSLPAAAPSKARRCEVEIHRRGPAEPGRRADAQRTPTSARIEEWIRIRGIPIVLSDVCRLAAGRRQRHRGEMAIQKTMQTLALNDPPQRGILLFEDHKLARAFFLMPSERIRVTNRAWLTFLERQQLIYSAHAI